MNTIHDAHMATAENYANLSKAKRLKVGAIVVKENRVISIGYNGTPAGWDNECENEIREDSFYVIDPGGPQYPCSSIRLETKPEVIHAEANAIAKLARSNESGFAADMYITHTPCFECSKLIHIAGIKKVYYRNQYRTLDGLEFLKKCNIEVEKI